MFLPEQTANTFHAPKRKAIRHGASSDSGLLQKMGIFGLLCSKLDGFVTGLGRRHSRRREAFTLVELLMVIGIMLLMMALVVPAFNGISGGTNFTEVSYDITGILDQARAYAMANRTYVYVGIGEFDVSQSSGAIPQNPGKGRVAVAVVASKDGTQDFANAVTQQGLDWQTNYGTPGQPGYDGGNLIAISKLRHFENVHLASSLPIPSSGPMARPVVPTSYILGNQASQTPFAWPLGSSLVGGCQYLFNNVIQFDPQGVARITYATNSDTIVQWMEIDLQQTHGTVISTGSNVAAVQIDAMTGATRIYRP